MLLLAAGVNYELTSADTGFLLHDAASQGNLAEIERLLAANTDVNKPTKKGNTPLDLAVENGNEEVAALLRKAIGK